MNIDFAPSPLATSPDKDGIHFVLESFPHPRDNLLATTAAANGHFDDIQTDLSTRSAMADVLDDNHDEASAPHHAARMNDAQAIDFMLRAGACVNVYSKDGLTPLHVATRYDALEAVDILLKKGAKPDATSTSSGATALQFAAQFGHKKIIERLLTTKNLDVDAADHQGITALHIAISRGYEDICRYLIDNGASIDIRTKQGHTCLHLATYAGSTDIVDLVIKTALRDSLRYPGVAIQSNKDNLEVIRFVNQKDADENSALHIAVQTGHLSMCQVLLQHGAEVDVQNKCSKSPLQMACMGKNREILELLIKHGAHINTKDRNLRTPLHSAASFGNPECIELLLKHLASIDQTDNDGMTPFLCAVATGHTNCAKMLLESGADIAVRDRYQRCCVHLAVQNEKGDVLKMLLQRSGSGLCNVPDMYERTALHYAVLSSETGLLDILLEEKANCLLQDGNGKTPLHIAAETENARHVKALVKASFASVRQKDKNGRTPLHFAALNGERKICSILLQMGADVDCPDIYGWTPLLFAAKTGAIGIIQMLLDLKASIDPQDETGNTALLIASAGGHVNAVRILLNRQASLKPDNNGFNCLDVAIENQQEDVIMAIIKNARWKEVLSAKSSDNQNRMGKLIQRFPTAAASVMDRCIQRSLPQRSITYDFRLLDPGPDDQSGLNGEPFFGLMFMVKHKQTDLLVHDLSRKLLKIKWRSYGWFVYWTNLALFSLFLSLMTYFMLTQRKLVTLKPQNSADSDDDNDDNFMQKDVFHNATGFLILIFASFHLVKEIYQIFTQRMGYFKQWTNVLEWVLYLSTIMFVLPYVFPSASKLRGDPKISWQMGTVAVFLGYMNLILFVQTLNYVGIYVTMFFRVATTVLKTIGLFTLFAVAFSVVFYILFREQSAFDTFFMTLMKVIVMTIGEIDYNTMLVDNLRGENPNNGAALVPYTESSFVFMCIFIFAMPIILMNLLVGLAVGDIESVQKYAFLRNKGKFIDFVLGVERNFPRFITRRFHKPELVVTGRYVERKITSGKFTFDDKDLSDEDSKTELEEKQRLEALTKELAKLAKRQMSIISTIHGQRNILLALAAKAGVDTHEDDNNVVI